METGSSLPWLHIPTLENSDYLQRTMWMGVIWGEKLWKELYGEPEEVTGWSVRMDGNSEVKSWEQPLQCEISCEFLHQIFPGSPVPPPGRREGAGEPQEPASTTELVEAPRCRISCNLSPEHTHGNMHQKERSQQCLKISREMRMEVAKLALWDLWASI